MCSNLYHFHYVILSLLLFVIEFTVKNCVWILVIVRVVVYRTIKISHTFIYLCICDHIFASSRKPPQYQIVGVSSIKTKIKLPHNFSSFTLRIIIKFLSYSFAVMLPFHTVMFIFNPMLGYCYSASCIVDKHQKNSRVVWHCCTHHLFLMPSSPCMHVHTHWYIPTPTSKKMYLSVTKS